ncbi:hypothetical protein T07_14951 [Trichinella nelsoni]|uniref:Uncharacterized protein n=1 Tax=Trichinella nelsoni TaxID=6336 RepID=A0A0V0RDX9_9BILA|nr:hypothetical protein T07_14951 [Trichinella nelsoni]
MQITIAIKGALSSVRAHLFRRKSENADDTKQIAEGTKQNKKRHAVLPWVPHSISLGLGYFERAKLSHIPMHKNRFPALRYANNDRHKRCLIRRKSENADDTKQIAEGTKQNKKRHAVLPWVPHSISLGLGYFERAKLSHSLIKLTTNLHG